MSVSFSEDSERYGYGFIGPEFIPPGSDEYYLRNMQLEAIYPGGRISGYRRVTRGELETLKSCGNRILNPEDFFVREPFEPELIRGSVFAGRVRLGALSPGIIRHHDYTIHSGIENSRIISCDIGDNPAIYDCRYLSHYIIGDRVILSSINEMDTTNHAKFGEGILKEGEDEKVRITLDLLNEAGGRSVLPFKELITADAYLWTVFRDDKKLMEAFFRITRNGADARRGFYGTIGHEAVIKHCRTIKDICAGDAVYVKGANKLKNLTIKSDKQEPSQIGEGVELVNGIIGYGCHVFYGCKAVRFVLGNNCSLKYGARLIHSVLGDNSTVSCCEVLNNLVFPAHEQHHNNSFLIATMIMGQSNLAAGATVGSNHNSRGNDGEIIAGRGFWPGLSSALKHNSRFASFVLIAKGSYPAELNIPLPFSLLLTSHDNSRRELMPGYWWMYNMYALERNAWKFKNRDTRAYKIQQIETDYLAPDTVNEIISATELLEEWAGGRGPLSGPDAAALSFNIGALERTDRPVRVIKPSAGYRAYREMLIYYAVKTVIANGAVLPSSGSPSGRAPPPGGWENLGGQLVPESKARALREDISSGKLASWEAVHGEYRRLADEYEADKTEHALQVLAYLNSTGGLPENLLDEAVRIRRYIEEQVYRTKAKDYADQFRNITYRNKDERDAVLGRLDDNAFIRTARDDTKSFIAMIEQYRSSVIK